MSTTKPRSLERIEFEEAAEAYLKSLPLEHFVEAPAQGTQRKITLASFEVMRVERPDIQLFNELLLQYRHGRPPVLRQVVPDNSAFLSNIPLKPGLSYDVPFQPTIPLLVMEYVSKHSKRKDYEDSFQKYERELKVPYYLLFYPDNQELTLFRRGARKYVSVKPNAQGRYSIPEIEVGVAILDGWVRYWFRGELVPLPGDLVIEVREARRQTQMEKRRADEQQRRADELARDVEQERQARALAERELAELRARVAEAGASGKKRS